MCIWQINKIIPTVTYHPSFRPQDDDQMQADKLAVSIYKHLHTCESSGFKMYLMFL